MAWITENGNIKLMRYLTDWLIKTFKVGFTRWAKAKVSLR